MVDSHRTEEIGSIYRGYRREIVSLLKDGRINMDDAKRLAGENVALYSNMVGLEDPQFMGYRDRTTEAQVNKTLEGTGVGVSVVGEGVAISTPIGRTYYDGNGHLGKIDNRLRKDYGE